MLLTPLSLHMSSFDQALLYVEDAWFNKLTSSQVFTNCAARSQRHY